MNELVEIKNEQVVTDSRNVAEHFEKRHGDVLDAIENIIKTENSVLTRMFYKTSYKTGTGKPYKMYLMNRDGFSLLVMGFTGKKALEWKLKYIEAFNVMEKQLKEQEQPKTQAEALLDSVKLLVEQERRIAAIEAAQEAQGKEVKRIREVVTLRPEDVDYRKKATAMMNRIAQSLGGGDMYRDVRNESYDLLEERMGVDLHRRLKNKKERMAQAGNSKTEISKVHKIDIICDDKKLREGYLAVIKDMAIHYGISDVA